METHDAWLAAAQSAEEAAMDILEMHPRSAISRFYFAAYSAAHATMIASGQPAPDRGNWAHETLATHFRSVLTRGSRAIRLRDASVFSSQLSDLYNMRIVADYGAAKSVDRAAAVDARRLAGPLVRLAERILNR
jgi:uncharacterized protein (UPF0332 family)